MCDLTNDEVVSSLDNALSLYRKASGDTVGEILSPIVMTTIIGYTREGLIDEGYDYIEGGATRDVFVMPCKEHVVKIQPRGSSNNREIEMSRRDIPCLVPVLEHSICGGWLVMPLADEPRSERLRERGRRVVERKIAQSGWEVQDPNDIHYIDGKPHLADYGAPWEKID